MYKVIETKPEGWVYPIEIVENQLVRRDRPVLGWYSLEREEIFFVSEESKMTFLKHLRRKAKKTITEVRMESYSPKRYKGMGNWVERQIFDAENARFSGNPYRTVGGFEGGEEIFKEITTTRKAGEFFQEWQKFLLLNS